MQKLSLSLFLIFTLSLSAEPLIIQPGLPGTSSKEINSKEAINIANTGFTKDDTVFMNHMIVHHEQALTLSRLAPNRTNTQEILDLAGRIDVSQEDEISFMQGWLEERNIEVHAHMSMHHMKMMGMASDQDIAELSNSKGMEFDELFLRLMIAHHEGALDMVRELKRQPGSAYDPMMFEFVSDLSNDQGVEIERMNTLLTGLSKDPRASLKGGLYHAEEAILNLDLVQSLKKPAGFFDPSNPLNERLSNEDEEDDEEKPLAERSRNSRSPMLSFSNTDMAFSGNVMVAGSYHGFNIYNLDNQGYAELVSSVICPGGQGDVSIVGNLLIMSVEQNRGRIDCGLQGAGTEPNPERFRGIRIFDISDLKRPQQVGAVQTCRGSHTHSVVSGPDENGIIIVYNSGTSSVRDQEELESCFEAIPGDNRTALFRIDVIEIPVADPSQAKIVKSPTVFADPETGALAGLWRGGDHGDDTQDTSRTDECHDITVFPSKNLAAGACSGNGILFDISDPYNPKRLDVVTDVGFAYWHSATFNNAGDKIVFTDEWGGGGRPRCRAWDPMDWGANAIYDIVDNKLVFKSHYKMPAPQTETENCVAHNGSIIPIPDRDIFVQAWYQGGLSVMDFTDSDNPIEIGYFDRGPISEEQLISGGYWSTYYYEGRIYGTEIARGIDVFEMTPSQFITQKEIDIAAKAYPAIGDKRLFNPQQQFPLTWPK
tara:strand:- start:707 stop:2839 length:2133 start_codon:yes stop_codon:yes gene_type:complete